MGEDYPVIGTSGKSESAGDTFSGGGASDALQKYLAADGIENVIRVLEDMEDEVHKSCGLWSRTPATADAW